MSFFFLLNSNVVEFIFLMLGCLEHNTRSFDQTIQVIQSQTKFNMSKILEKYKIFPKSRMNIPLCYMVLMLVVHLSLKINILRME